jgi:hypothetical protein
LVKLTFRFTTKVTSSPTTSRRTSSASARRPPARAVGEQQRVDLVLREPLRPVGGDAQGRGDVAVEARDGVPVRSACSPTAVQSP